MQELVKQWYSQSTNQTLISMNCLTDYYCWWKANSFTKVKQTKLSIISLKLATNVHQHALLLTISWISCILSTSLTKNKKDISYFLRLMIRKSNLLLMKRSIIKVLAAYKFKPKLTLSFMK